MNFSFIANLKIWQTVNSRAVAKSGTGSLSWGRSNTAMVRSLR
ncbi:hypothetical protein [Microcoleus sp. S36bC1]